MRMTFTAEQQQLLADTPVPAASEGQTFQQAVASEAGAFLHVCGLEGWRPLPPQAAVEGALRAKAAPAHA